MGQINDLGRAAFRDFSVEGLPASGAHEPVKSDVRAVYATIDAALASLGVNGAITVKAATKATLDGTLSHAANTLGIVYNDVAANNGIYVKVGASGSGSWSKTALAIPSSFAGDLATILANQEAVLAAALQTSADREAIEDLASGAPDAPSILNKAFKDGSNIQAPEFRAALELGDAAVKDTGTTAGTVAAGDDPRLEAVQFKADLDGSNVAAPAFRDNLGIVASVIAWTNGLVGGVARFISDKLGETVSVKDFGAVCDGVTDDTAAWQAAHDSLSSIWGGKIVAPNGKHLLGTLTVSRRCLEIEASGEVIAKNANGHVIYNPTGRYMKINGMKMSAAVTRSADAFIYLGPNAQFAQVKGVNFAGHYVGIEIDGASISVVRDCEFRDPTKHSEYAGGAHIAVGRNNLTTAPLIDSCVSDTDEAGSGLPVVADMISYGIALYYADAAIIANCDIIRSGKDLALIPAAGQVVANTKVCNSFFDTAEYGVYIVPESGGAVARTAFINSWASNHSSRNVLLFGNGPVIGTKFVGSEFQISAGDAFLLGGNVTDTVIDRNSIAGNAGSGVSVGNGVTKLRITNNKIGPNDDFGPNGFGVFIGTGCSDYLVQGNDLRGNTGAALTDSSAATDGYILGNLGVVTKNKGSDAIASGASSKVVTHGGFRTPVASDLVVTANSALGTNSLWVDPALITSTQFTVKTGNGAAAANLAFSWRLDMENI